MTEETAEAQDPTEAQAPSKLDLLKKRADLVGMKYHHRVGETKLREQLNKFMAEKEKNTADAQEAASGPGSVSHNKTLPSGAKSYVIDSSKETAAQSRERKRKESMRLIRVRITCMNPNKREYEGDIYAVSNSVVGTVRKYIPFNAENGWHIPQILLNHLQERKCQIFYNVKGPRGNKIRKGKLIKEMNIEILPPLTPQELKDLAQQQAMAHSVD